MGGPGGDRDESRARRERLSRLATDYPALEARLHDVGVDGLIAELTEHEHLEYWYSDIPPVRRALIRGRDALAADPAALPAVLVRYLWGEEDAIDRLRRHAATRVVKDERPPWEGETIAPIDEIPHTSPWVEALFPLPSGARALAVGSDGAVAVVAPGTGEVLAERPVGPDADDVLAASFRAPWLHVADLGGRVVRWRVSDAPDAPDVTGPETVLAPDPGLDLDDRPGQVALAVAALPNPDRLLVGCVDGAVRLVDLATGTTAWTPRHDGPVNALAVTPDGRVAVSGADDGVVRVWDVATGRAVHALRGHSRSVRAVAVSPDGRAIASGSADRTTRLWVDGRCTAVLAGAETGGDPVPELGPAPSGTTGHWRAVTAVLLTADDVVTASSDHTIRLWDRATAAETAVLAGEPFGLVTRHEGAVRALALGDGWLLSGGHDGRLLVWDALSLALEPFPAPAPPAAPPPAAASSPSPPPPPPPPPPPAAGPGRAPSSAVTARWAAPDRDLFVSYKSEDVMLVRPVVDALLAAGARVWFAEYEILLAGRERFAEAIATGIRRSRRALLFTNDRYLSSPYCRDEVEQCLAVHGVEGIIEVMLPEEQGSHAAYPALAGADWTEGADPDRIAAWVARRVGVTPVRRPPLVHHVYRDAAGRHSGADRSPGTHRDTLAGLPYSVDVTGWTLEKPPRDRRHDPTWLPTYKYAVEGPPLFVNIAAGLDVSPEAQRAPGVADDRAVYDYLLGYAPRHLGALGAAARGVHLLLHRGTGQMGLTYHAGGCWTRKVSVITRSPAGSRTAEFVFTFGLLGTWEEYCLLSGVMDRLATSTQWG